MGETEVYEENMRSIIDNYIKLHKAVYEGKCHYPIKQFESLCDRECDKCSENYYDRMRSRMLNSVGLEV